MPGVDFASSFETPNPLHPEERPPGPAEGRPEDKLRRVTKGEGDWAPQEEAKSLGAEKED